MTDNQPEALRLADWIECADRLSPFAYASRRAAAELRRLHALCDEMGETVEMLLWLIDRDAPQLSGKTIGYAQASLAKWKESK